MLTALLLTAIALQDPPFPHRQFDFWVGEWSVQNRHMLADATWRNGDVTRARITPVCGGMAILEEWAGTFDGDFMNGFSLRAYDPQRKDWDLLLNWTTDGNGEFGNLRGRFRHGRGEFFGGKAPKLTRYCFSDGLPSSVRWDSSTTTDGGVTWKTDWIMEFSRTRAAEEVTQDELFNAAWTTGKVSPHEEARHLDWMLGRWEGTQVDAASGKESEARLRCKLLNKDCLVLDVLETRNPKDEDWDGRLSIRGYSAEHRGWSSYSLSESDTVIRKSSGTPGDGIAVFESKLEDGAVMRETLQHVLDNTMTILEERRASGEQEFQHVRETELRRGQ